MRPRREGARLGDALGSYVRRLDRSGLLGAARVVEAWPEAAGPEIVKHTAGVFLRKGELVVYVDSPVWATELAALSGPLREALNQRLGEELVRTIRFTVSRKVTEGQALARSEKETDEFYAEDVVEPVALSDAEVEQVRRSASAIRNETLRETVIRATVKDLEWKRGVARSNEAREQDKHAP